MFSCLHFSLNFDTVSFGSSHCILLYTLSLYLRFTSVLVVVFLAVWITSPLDRLFIKYYIITKVERTGPNGTRLILTEFKIRRNGRFLRGVGGGYFFIAEIIPKTITAMTSMRVNASRSVILVTSLSRRSSPQPWAVGFPSASSI